MNEAWTKLTRAEGFKSLEHMMEAFDEQLRSESLSHRGYETQMCAPSIRVIDQQSTQVGAPMLTQEDIDTIAALTGECNDGSRSIGLNTVELLMRASGAELSNIEPGSDDIPPLRCSQLLKEYIMRVREEMCEPGSLRFIPEVTLLKVLTLRMAKSDAFYLEYFGLLYYRDNNGKQARRRKETVLLGQKTSMLESVQH